MTRHTHGKFLAGLAVVPLVALAVAGCGGGDDDDGGSAAPPKTSTGAAATLGVENNDNLGNILDDSQGRTLYLFKKDTGTKSECFGACAAAWPPLRVTGKPTVGSGAKASLIGTTKRSDGNAQVTYNGHPLYRYEADSQPGDTNGEGLNVFGGAWFAVSPAGNQVSGQSSSAGGGPVY